MEMDVDTPEKVAPALRAIADRYRESAGELAITWQDSEAGKIWSDFAVILERAAASCERARARRGV